MPTKQAEAKQSEKKAEKRSAKAKRPNKKGREEQEFDQMIIDVARVSRVTEGGKRMSFRATVAVGDRKGRVGLGVGKGLDVTGAINKAADRGKKNIINVPIDKTGTIPHEVALKFSGAQISMRPGKQGTGIIAGGVMRMIFELAGVKNVTAKMHGSINKINNAKATVEALGRLETQESRAKKLS